MRSSHPRSPIDHPSNGSKSQFFCQLRSLFLYIYIYGVTSLHHTRCSPPSLFSTSPVARRRAPPPPSPPLHCRPHPAIAPVTKVRGKDRQDPLYLFLQPRWAQCPCIVDEPALRRSSGGVLSSGPPWTEAPPGLRVVDPVHRLFLLKNNSISYKFWEFYTKPLVFCSNYKLALCFRFYLISSPV
jgi:hypothetical protein